MAQHAPQLARAELLPAAPPPVLLSHPTYAAAIAILVLDIKREYNINTQLLSS